MDPIERYKLEDEARSLAERCTCYSYHGPCRFCVKLEKIHRQLDEMDIEERVVKDITAWICDEKFRAISVTQFIQAMSHGLATREWKKKAQ